MSNQKITRSFRIDPDVLKKCEEMGIDHNRIVEAALINVIKLKKCPTCCQALPIKKPKTK